MRNLSNNGMESQKRPVGIGKKKKMSRLKKRILSIVAVCLCGLVITGVAWFISTIRAPAGLGNAKDKDSNLYNNSSDTDIPDSLKNQLSGDNAQRAGVYTFLLGGVDGDETRTDVIMLVTLDTNKKTINVLSIPRDTMVKSSSSGNYHKLNSSYGMKGGIDTTRTDIAKLTGYYINRYVIINFDGFVKLIDAVGGVWFNVPRNMKYSDPTQDLYINLKEGYQLLDGKKAIQLVRYRKGYVNADLGRINVTQDFMLALFKTLTQAKNILKFQSYADMLLNYTKTDMTIGECVWLAGQAKGTKSENIQFFTAPGYTQTVYGASYFIIKEDEMLTMINQYMNPLTDDIQDVYIVTPGASSSSHSSSSSPTATRRPTATKKPTTTKRPTATPKPTSSNNDGNNYETPTPTPEPHVSTGGEATATPKPTATSTPTATSAEIR